MTSLSEYDERSQVTLDSGSPQRMRRGNVADVRRTRIAVALLRPLALFACLCTRWTSVRKVKEGETTNDLFRFLTH